LLPILSDGKFSSDLLRCPCGRSIANLLPDAAVHGFCSLVGVLDGRIFDAFKFNLARPEIGDYPFTTLVPNLGVVSYRDDKSFVMADIPGIIEGAAEGKGLGIRFLRHIERNSILLFLIPADAKDIGDQYRILLGELRKYNPELLDKKRLLAISKVDMLDEELMKEMEREIPKDLPYVFISSISQFNLEKLKDLIWQAIHS
jgi:GTP-binding protein